MSLSSALFSGISGLSTLGNSMTVIGDNIANVNTIGFKSSRVTFQDVLSQTVATTAGTAQVGRGTSMADISSSFSQGSFESTDSTTDLAIGGEGFFQVRDPNNAENVFYTRAGEFRFDKDGNFTNPAGYIVLGWVLDEDTGEDVGSITDIVLDSFTSSPKQTDEITLITNLDADAEDISINLARQWNGADPNNNYIGENSYEYQTTVKVYDSLGSTHDITIYYDKGTGSTYEFIVTCNPDEDKRSDVAATDPGLGMLAKGILTFNEASGAIQGVECWILDPTNTVTDVGAPVIAAGETYGSIDPVATGTYIGANATYTFTVNTAGTINDGTCSMDWNDGLGTTGTVLLFGTSQPIGTDGLEVDFGQAGWTVNANDTFTVECTAPTADAPVLSGYNPTPPVVSGTYAGGDTLYTFEESTYGKIGGPDVGSGVVASGVSYTPTGGPVTSGTYTGSGTLIYDFTTSASGNIGSGAAMTWNDGTTSGSVELAHEPNLSGTGASGVTYTLTTSGGGVIGSGASFHWVSTSGASGNITTNASFQILSGTTLQVDFGVSGQILASGTTFDVVCGSGGVITSGPVLSSGYGLFQYVANDGLQVKFGNDGEALNGGDEFSVTCYAQAAIGWSASGADPGSGTIFLSGGNPYTDSGWQGLSIDFGESGDILNLLDKFTVLGHAPHIGEPEVTQYGSITPLSSGTYAGSSTLTYTFTVTTTGLTIGSGAVMQWTTDGTIFTDIDPDGDFQDVGPLGLQVDFGEVGQTVNVGDTFTVTCYGPNDLGNSNVWDPQTDMANDLTNGYFAFNADFLGGTDTDMDVELNFGTSYNDSSGQWTNDSLSTTQYSSASTTTFQSANGYGAGDLQSVTVATDGAMTGQYSNGQVIPLYRVALAKFQSNQGLFKVGGNLFRETRLSGRPTSSKPGTNGLGSISPNSLEQSNVDIATEFVKMITTQRGFQANSKIIKVTDEMLAELINLKR